MADFKPKGRRTIRRKLPGTDTQSRHVGLWDISAEPGTTLAGLESAYLFGLEAVDRVEARKTANIKSGKFTETGVTDDAQKFTFENIVGPLHRARTTVLKAKSELAGRRAKLTLQAPDKTDIAAAMLRQEIRAHLRAMPPDERVRYVSANLKPAIAEAILTAPPELSGIAETSVSLAALTEKALEAQHPGEMERLAELQRAVELAERAIEIGRDEIRQEVGITDPVQFNAMAEPYEAKAAAPWLRKRGQDVKVVDLERGIERPATDDEQKHGVFYPDAESYERGRAA